MSRTSATSEERAGLYETPSWCVHLLLDRAKVLRAGGAYLEPSVGAGAIIASCNAAGVPARWTGIDIRLHDTEVRDLCAFVRGDFLPVMGHSPLGERRFDAVIMNPPYPHAQAFVDEALRRAPVVAALLRLGFLASAERATWWRTMAERPLVGVLSRRPSFAGYGSDATDYGWFVWGVSRGGVWEVW